MKKILSFLPTLAMLLALAGCCANDTCNCQDELADALFFSFVLGGPNGFAASDVDTLTLVRTSHANASTNTVATSQAVTLVLPLTQNGLALKRDSIIINNATPFSLTSGNPKLSAYDYRIIAYHIDQVAGRKVKTSYVFKIDNINLDGHYSANGCCTCYMNTSKRFNVNTIANDTVTLATVTTQPNADGTFNAPKKPVVTLLTKK